MTPIDADIITMRAAGMTRRSMAAKLGMNVRVLEERIGLLLAEGLINEGKRGKPVQHHAPAPRVEEVAPPPRPMGMPPSKLPEGRAGYDCAAAWLEQWGQPWFGSGMARAWRRGSTGSFRAWRRCAICISKDEGSGWLSGPRALLLPAPLDKGVRLLPKLFGQRVVAWDDVERRAIGHREIFHAGIVAVALVI